jgi:hypothetical protein
LAADEGYCQHAEQLSPGEDDESLEDIGEDEEERQQLWVKFYHQARDAGQQKASGAKASSSTSAPKKQRTAKDRLNDSLDALATQASKQAETLGKVKRDVEACDSETDFTDFATDLRATRDLLERQCVLIDNILAFVGFADEPSEDGEEIGSEQG